MELVTTLPADTPLHDVGTRVRRIEALGFDTVHIPETVHDSLSVALLALEHSTTLTVRTSMTLAFPRSPMVTAYAAWDLARFSGGRFQLGLASQVRGNIVGRFSVPWSRPSPWLADYIGALRAIFAAFTTGEPLDYHGSHFRFDRLQPYFNPGPASMAAPPIWTGGVNRRMCLVAGAHADGYVSHATNSHPRFLRGTTLPALAEGASSAGRSDGGPRVVVVPFCVTGADKTTLDASRELVRRELAFLYSTPAYRPTLSMLGHEQLGARLTELVGQRRWQRLSSVLTDEVLSGLVPEAGFAELPDVLHEWYGGLCEGLAIRLPEDPADDARFAGVLESIKDIPTRHDHPAT
ncbi:LLM class F420-dependent oxidoreductase [Prauserella marina]|uniref:Probable F420-dependent oxidoreductase, MSMEG_2256 family n=1 Tax=Prauserella marina TaxID=530584 RepID=A0A222VQX6_9PSEU|nr:TIGR03617 family F420-dependent LLM class oxidoreductase [Prauserella marina]ASR36309.1 LLM class F420-dependent oxidoreductase [Prauserella marina]PWV77089.1 putative F420-dependent oxidoreductase [Prauserella marina]SDD04149.1 probable F420-dependent oxidoreductase, MSMEG_2256 family [Prauserella marina]